MNMLYSIIYIILDIFGTYLSLCSIRTFNGTSIKNKRNEVFSYIFWHILSYLVAFSSRDIYILFVLNITSAFLVSFNYISPIKRKIFATCLTWIIGWSTEFVGTYIFNGSLIEVNLDIHISLCSKILHLIILILLSKYFKSTVTSIKSNIQWYIPIIFSLIMLFLDIAIQLGNIDFIQMILCISLMASMIISLISIYKTDQEILKKENIIFQQRIDNYKMQYKQLHESYDKFHSYRHKLKDHFIDVNGIISGNYGENKELREIMNLILLESLDISNDLIETDNLEIDSIINAKINEINEKGIEVNRKILIPEQMDVDISAFSMIVNNIFDAVLKEVCDVKGKNLDFIMKYDSEYVCIYWIHISNGTDIYMKNFFKKHKRLIRDTKMALKRHNGRLFIELDDENVIWNVIMYAGDINDLS